MDVEGVVGIETRGLWGHEGKMFVLLDGQVCACAKRPVTGPRQHHNAYLWFAPAPSKRVGEILEHDRRERVALLRAVEHHCGDVTIDRKGHLLERWSLNQPGNRRAPARWTRAHRLALKIGLPNWSAVAHLSWLTSTPA